MKALALALFATVSCSHHCEPVVVVVPCAEKAERNPYNPPLVIHKSTLTLDPDIEQAIEKVADETHAMLAPRIYDSGVVLNLGTSSLQQYGGYWHGVDGTPHVDGDKCPRYPNAITTENRHYLWDQ